MSRQIIPKISLPPKQQLLLLLLLLLLLFELLDAVTFVLDV
jgi:hypothetical protein